LKIRGWGLGVGVIQFFIDLTPKSPLLKKERGLVDERNKFLRSDSMVIHYTFFGHLFY
jgi:hypothetical protein